MKLIIVRHGETEANVKGINQGQSHGKLTGNGVSQADKLGKRLAKEKIDIIYCSDLGRAKHTAKEIRKYVKAPIRYVKDIKERNLGVFDGKTFGSFTEYVKKNNLDMFTYRPRGGESRKDVRDRVMRFFNQCLEKHPDKTVLWVTHGGIMNRMNVYFMKVGDSHYSKFHPMNCAVSVVEAQEDGKHKMRLVNCTKHLEKKSRKKFGAKRKNIGIHRFLPII